MFCPPLDVEIERTLFVMADIIVIIILVLLIGSSAAYMIRAKKNGVKCIGCPAGGSCPGSGKMPKKKLAGRVVGSGSEVAAVMALTKAAALAYLMFNLYTPPCFAALGAMNSEMKSGKWLFGGICLQLATGYTVAFLVYQVGTLVTTGALGTAFVPGLIAVLAFAAVIVWRIRKSDREFAAEYSLHAS